MMAHVLGYIECLEMREGLFILVGEPHDEHGIKAIQSGYSPSVET